MGGIRRARLYGSGGWGVRAGARSLPSDKNALVESHARGDNNRARKKKRRVCGSPPRPWGQCSGVRTPSARRRFTPTPVGTIRPARRHSDSKAVHPHARGDNDNGSDPNLPVRGSPPRPWGQLGLGRRDRWVERFTPTPVGTMQRRPHPISAQTVHPHARGDNPASQAP